MKDITTREICYRNSGVRGPLGEKADFGKEKLKVFAPMLESEDTYRTREKDIIYR